MRALEESFANGGLEGELRSLFVRLYNESLAATASEIDVYGAPHLGPFSLIERNVTADGLVMRRQDDESGMRYLFKAWRNRNPRRGMHFLRTYLRVLYGSIFEVRQLWQRKDSPYPTALRSQDEIRVRNESLDDYFLTSRVRIDIVTDVVPDRIIKSLRSAVAARFVLNVRAATVVASELPFATTFNAVAVARTVGETVAIEYAPPAKQQLSLGTVFSTHNVAYTRSQ